MTTVQEFDAWDDGPTLLTMTDLVVMWVMRWPDLCFGDGFQLGVSRNNGGVDILYSDCVILSVVMVPEAPPRLDRVRIFLDRMWCVNGRRSGGMGRH